MSPTASVSEVSLTCASFHATSISDCFETMRPARSTRCCRMVSARGGRRTSSPPRDSSPSERSSRNGPK